MKHEWLTVAAVAGALALSPALAQEGMDQPQGQPQERPQEQPRSGQPATQPVTELDRAAATGLLVVDKDVYSGRNEKVGKVKEVIQGPEGNVEAILLDVGGIAGIGKKTVSISAGELQVQGGRIVVPSMNRDQIMKLPRHR